jgi:hypothetical protein
MRGKRIPYNEIKDFTEKDDPIEFVKLLFDSISTNVHQMPSPEWGDIRAVTHYYQRIKDEKLKKKFEVAVVSLMKDKDYAGNAIEAAANIPLIEAKEQFVEISRMSYKEAGKLNYPGGNPKNFLLTYCSYFFEDFKDYLILKLTDYSDSLEFITALAILSRKCPAAILDNIEKYFKEVLEDRENFERSKYTLGYITANICNSLKNDYCLNLCERFKVSMSKDFNKLYYKSLEDLPRFNPYLPEIKKILEV